MRSVIVIGGGFFGLYLAEHLAVRGSNVTVIEKEASLMTMASYVNQARVHNGYHYPRSVLTAMRSTMSFPRFVNEFADCIQSDFDKYYMVGQPLGKISGKQFKLFCQRIGVFCETAPDRIQRLMNPRLIQACFKTKEYAFNASRLRSVMETRVLSAGVKVQLGETVSEIREAQRCLRVSTKGKDGQKSAEYEGKHVFNCTYASINLINMASKTPIVPLVQEMTELCLVEVPDELKGLGLTVMCGPFFSVMPFPPEGLHSFSHVRYTPHHEWREIDAKSTRQSDTEQENWTQNSAWFYMQKDAQRYVPLLGQCQYKKSLWTTKTIQPRSDVDDSRPILFICNHGMSGYHCVLGGKIDNVYDAVSHLDNVLDL